MHAEYIVHAVSFIFVTIVVSLKVSIFSDAASNRPPAFVYSVREQICILPVKYAISPSQSSLPKDCYHENNNMEWKAVAYNYYQNMVYVSETYPLGAIPSIQRMHLLSKNITPVIQGIKRIYGM